MKKRMKDDHKKRKSIAFVIPESWCALIDSERGDTSRSLFVRRIVERHLRKKHGDKVGEFIDGRGREDGYYA